MDSKKFGELIDGLNIFLAARLISRFEPATIQERLKSLPAGKARQINELINYPSSCAAFMMDPKVTIFTQDATVKDALKRLRSLKDRKLYQVFLTDEEGHLTHTLSIQDIAISDSDTLLTDLSDRPTISISALAPREEVVEAA